MGPRPPLISEMSDDSDIIVPSTPGDSDSDEYSEDESNSLVTEQIALPPIRTEDNNGRFRMRTRRFMLTYPVHLVCVDVIEELRKRIKKDSVSIRAVRETGSTGHQHTHVLVACSELITINNPRFFDYKESHPNIRICKSILHLKNCIKYLDKQGKSEGDDMYVEDCVNLGDVRNRVKLREAILQCKTWKQVIRTQPVWGCMKWAQEVFNAKDVKFGIEKEVRLYDWQKSLVEKVENPAPNEERLIHWVWSEEGNVGKTFMAKYLSDNYDAIIFRNSGVKDIVFAYNYEPVVIFDLPRTDDSHIQYIYNLLEQFKDGYVFSAKYASVVKKMPIPPIVVVFANKPPLKVIDGRETMSEDRWDIIRVGMRSLGSTKKRKRKSTRSVPARSAEGYRGYRR